MTQNLVNIAVCGKFHVLNYVPDLAQAGRLNRLYTAARGAALQGLALTKSQRADFPLKEYLIHGHTRVFGQRGYEAAIPVYTGFWQRSVVRNWSPASVLHVLSLGAERLLIERAHADGAKVVSEVVNTHPAERLERLAREAARWGVENPRSGLFPREKKLIETAAQADLILAPSQHVADTFKARGFGGALSVLPYAANTDRFTPDPNAQPRAPGSPLRVAAVGQVGLRKGQLYLLEAARRLGPSKIQLTLAGNIDAQVQPALAAYAGHFTHIARVPHAKMPEFLRRQDVFVSPSVEEGLAVSICEAMGAGCAVVASRASGAEEVIQDGKSGLLFDAGDQEALVAHLERLFDDPNLSFKMGQAAAARTRDFINWHSYAAGLEKIYDLVVQ